MCFVYSIVHVYLQPAIDRKSKKSMKPRPNSLLYNRTKTNRKMKHLYTSSTSSAPPWSASLILAFLPRNKIALLAAFRIGGVVSGAPVSARVAAQLLAASDHAHRERRRLGRYCEEVQIPLRRRTGRDWVNALGGRQQVERFGYRGGNRRSRWTRPNLDSTSNGK